jgi:ribokinase
MAVLVIGSFNLDHVWRGAALPQAGETRAGHYACGPGGKGFNQAVAAARCGADTHFLCALGNDDAAGIAVRLAATNGMAVHAQAAPVATGCAGIFVDAAGRNQIVVAAGANACLDAAHVRAHAHLFAAGQVLLAQCETPAEATLAAFTLARRHGARRLLNPAPADAEVTAALLDACDLLLPNESEFAALAARHLGQAIAVEDVANLDAISLHALCRRLLPHGDVVVTLGSAGVFASPAQGTPRRLAAEVVRVLDTTGAGDAFCGALAAALATPGALLAEALVFANRYAALSTERAGAALAMPTREECNTRFGG